MKHSIVFCADLHLATGAWKSMPQICGDSYASFRQIVDFCLRNVSVHGGTALILGGDVFDSPRPSPDAVEVFTEGMVRLEEANIRAFHVVGQHERDHSAMWSSVYHHCRSLSRAAVAFPPFDIAGMDNMPADELRDALSKLTPATAVLVLHQACKGAVPDVEGRCDLDPDWIPPTVKLVLLGDIHTPWDYTREVSDNGIVKKTRFIYPGSIAMQSLDEPPEKKFVHVIFDDAGNFEVNYVPLKTRPFLRQVLSRSEDVEASLLMCKSREAESLIVIKYDPRLGELEQKFREVNPNAHFVFQLLPNETLGVSVDVTQIKGISLKGCLDSVVKPEADPVLHGFLTRLLDSADSRAELAVQKKGFLEHG